MDEDPDELVRREIGPTEQMLWAGRPRQGVVLRAADAFMIPVSLLWGGTAILIEAKMIASGASWIMEIFGAPLVVLGLYILLGRFWVDTRQRARTVYGVTSERVVFVSGIIARQVKSLSIDTLSDVSLHERSDGSGVITFGPVLPLYWWYGGAPFPGFDHQFTPRFELVGEARKVYEIICRAQRASRHCV
jgi:hypothetical protein